MLNLALVGCGNMGRTYAEAFLAGRLLERQQLFIVEHSEAKCAALRAEGFPNTYAQPGEYLAGADVILLATKPQDAGALFPLLRPHIGPGAIVLSIMAGVPVARLAAELGTEKVVRAMPNLPAQISQGMTVYTAAPALSRPELLLVQNLLGTTGKCVYVEHEDLLDAATAISGSGPGYVFYFMDLMAHSAEQLGFTPAQAALLVEQTFLGAVQLLRADKASPREWISRVASRGGTTQAALDAFAAHGLPPAMQAGIQAAYRRAGQLAGNTGTE